MLRRAADQGAHRLALRRSFRATTPALGLLKGIDPILTADLLHVLRYSQFFTALWPYTTASFVNDDSPLLPV